MSRPEIEPRSPGPLANTLPARSMDWVFYIKYSYWIQNISTDLNAFKYFYSILIIIWFQEISI